MPNIVREFQKNHYYHIYNRGNHRQAVFLEPFDYEYFLRLLDENARKFKIKIIAYCLMRNHFHMLAQQMSEDDDSISKWIGCSTMSYAHYFNSKYKQVGSLFQCRFKAKAVLTDAYLYHLSQYIHLNPSEFTDPYAYQWSSIQAYRLGRTHIADPRPVLKLLQGRPYELNKEVVLSKREEVRLLSLQK